MARILVNGLKSKTGGGRSILNNYLSLLSSTKDGHKYFVLTPSRDEYLKFETEGLTIVEIPSLFNKNLFFLALYFFVLPALLRRYEIDLVFNLGDIVIPTRTRQVYLFDWAYAIYPESDTWRRMPARERLSRRAKVFFIRRWIRGATATIAQTEIAGERLRHIYGVESVEVVPNAVSLENMGGGEEHDFGLPAGRKLLCLTYYYTHKNLEVLLPVARRILERGLDYRIVVTLHPDQDPGAAAFLDQVRSDGLGEAIVNVGPVPMARVPSLYRQSDAMILPTLLESFSGTYVEAMYHGKPVFTSDLDFAHAVCGDAAWYFDPFEPESVLATVEKAYRSGEDLVRKVESGRRRVASMPAWPQTFARIQEILTGASGPTVEPATFRG